MATKKKSALGRGVNALIPPSGAGNAGNVGNVGNNEKNKGNVGNIGNSENIGNEIFVRVSEIEPNRSQPRKNFDETALEELAASITEFGVIQPLVVQKRDGYYEIIAGERRWRAAKKAGLKEVPVVIKDYSNEEIVEVALIENIQREDLNPIEEAAAYKRLLEEYNLKQEDLAKKISKSRTAITNSVRLLKLADEVQQMVMDNMITGGHARALLALANREDQIKLAGKIFDENMSVRETEQAVKDFLKPKIARIKEENRQRDIIYESLESKMKDILGTKVNIVGKTNKKGKIEIEYYSMDELERITDIISGRY